MPRFSFRDLADADRRSVLKILGVSSAAAAGTGLGVFALSGSAAAAEVNVSAQDPATTESDDGDLDEVFVEPTLSVTWDGFDDVVGKVRILIEAATGERDLDPPEFENLDFTPVFRATGYANGTDNDAEQESGPGTNGEFTLDWFADGEHVTLYGGGGKPDYENAEYNCGATMETYLDGSLMGDPIEDARNGFYGPAGDTEQFEEETDSGSNATTVYLRYTVSLHRPDISFVEEDGYDLAPEDVRPFSPLAMAGGEGGQYPDMTDGDWGTTVTAEEADDYEDLSEGDVVPATAIPYDVLQDSTDHPAIMSDYTRFNVEIENEPADAGVTGDSDAGVSVDEEVGTTTPSGNESGSNTNTTGGNESVPDGTESVPNTDTPGGNESVPSGNETAPPANTPTGNTSSGGNQSE